MKEQRARPRSRRGKLGFWYGLAVALLWLPLTVLTRRRWSGAENLPAGGFVVCVNHVSYLDPLTLAHFLYNNGRLPRFLTKQTLFRLPFVGSVLRGAGQIPVYRETVDAGDAYAAAVVAVRDGECVVVYPEATLTRDPELWPMTGKTGGARIALTTGAPLVPIAQWGAQEMLAPYTRRPHVLPPKTIQVRAGEPIDLSPFAGRVVDADLLREVTDLVMATITGLLEELRGEQAPAVRFDPRRESRSNDPDPPVPPARTST